MWRQNQKWMLDFLPCFMVPIRPGRAFNHLWLICSCHAKFYRSLGRLPATLTPSALLASKGTYSCQKITLPTPTVIPSQKNTCWHKHKNDVMQLETSLVVPPNLRNCGRLGRKKCQIVTIGQILFLVYFNSYIIQCQAGFQCISHSLSRSKV